MKTAHLKALSAVIAVAAAMAGTAQAQVVGASSDTANVKIAASTVVGGPHTSGKVGIWVPKLLTTQYIDFAGLAASIPVDGNGVYTFTNATGTITDHSKYGRFDFAKVSGQDVWFGEWSQTANAAGGDHTVYYGGTGASTVSNVLAQGATTVNYSVKGISDYATNSILSGNFAAAFNGSGGGTLTGNVTNGTYNVNIGSATISGATFSGSGATATSGATTLASSGAVSGQFFGSNVDALAGIVSFSSNNQYNTAFGGTR